MLSRKRRKSLGRGSTNMDFHPSCIIDDGAEVGEGTRIWHWTHVSSRAQIGKKCTLGQNVYIGNDVRIGNNVKIQNNVSVYDSVYISDDVFCGPSMVFTNVYNPRSEVPRKDQYLRTYVEKGVTMGANSTIICGIRIGRYAFVAAGAVVTRDVKPFALVMGVPARQVGWMSEFGERMALPLTGEASWQCPSTNTLYLLKDGEITISSGNQ